MEITNTLADIYTLPQYADRRNCSPPLVKGCGCGEIRSLYVEQLAHVSVGDSTEATRRRIENG